MFWKVFFILKSPVDFPNVMYNVGKKRAKARNCARPILIFENRYVSDVALYLQIAVVLRYIKLKKKESRPANI